MVVAREVGGVEMGVLPNGTPFLTGSGLAKVCGVPRSVIYERAKDWKDGKRDGKLARLLSDAGFDEPLMYTPLPDGSYAFTDSVCTIVIEYYAFDANIDVAKQNLRILTRQSLREYIYKSVGYDARTILSPAWRDFHDRVLLSLAPVGFFSVFREMNEFLIRAIQAGMPFSPETVPDISVGKLWSTYWTDNNLDAKFGPRHKEPHSYPDYYPQSASNPQPIWVYPIDSLVMFRRWMDEHYLPNKFPAYLQGKVRQNVLSQVEAVQLVAAVVPAALGSGV